jgi:hypothetical protein
LSAFMIPLIRATYPSYLILFNLILVIIFGQELRSSSSDFLHPFAESPLSDPNSSLSALVLF